MNEDQFLKRKPRKCPKCGFSPVASILYGMPAYDDELERRLENKSLVLGGCMEELDAPKWQCVGCDRQFYSWESSENPKRSDFIE